MIGQILAHYEILDKLGSGGMGEVYRARDTKLKRVVAFKVLSERFVGDHERMARFEREARVLASLNHPNIAAIYGLEETDGVSHSLWRSSKGKRWYRGSSEALSSSKRRSTLPRR